MDIFHSLLLCRLSDVQPSRPLSLVEMPSCPVLGDTGLTWVLHSCLGASPRVLRGLVLLRRLRFIHWSASRVGPHFFLFFILSKVTFPGGLASITTTCQWPCPVPPAQTRPALCRAVLPEVRSPSPPRCPSAASSPTFQVAVSLSAWPFPLSSSVYRKAVFPLHVPEPRGSPLSAVLIQLVTKPC